MAGSVFRNVGIQKRRSEVRICQLFRTSADTQTARIGGVVLFPTPLQVLLEFGLYDDLERRQLPPSATVRVRTPARSAASICVLQCASAIAATRCCGLRSNLNISGHARARPRFTIICQHSGHLRTCGQPPGTEASVTPWVGRIANLTTTRQAC